MEYKQFGKTRLNVSRICFGTWAYGGDWGKFDMEQSKAAIQKAFSLGINFFDTAQAYGWGLSERILGEALSKEIKNKRDKVILATKGGLRMDGNNLLRDSSPKWLRKGVEESLKLLGVDTIDLYQVHWPDPKTPFEETAAELKKMVQEGKIRYVGVSNFNEREMAEFERFMKIDSLQPPYHLFRRSIENGILPYTKSHDIAVMVYGPLAHGFLTGKFTADQKFGEDDWRSKSAIFKGEMFANNLRVVEQLKQVAKRQNCTLAQLSLGWILANPAIDVAIVGVRNATQISETAPGGDVHLQPDILAEIEHIMKSSIQFAGPTPESI